MMALNSIWHVAEKKLSTCLKVITSLPVNIKYIKCLIEAIPLFVEQKEVEIGCSLCNCHNAGTAVAS